MPKGIGAKKALVAKCPERVKNGHFYKKTYEGDFNHVDIGQGFDGRCGFVAIYRMSLVMDFDKNTENQICQNTESLGSKCIGFVMKVKLRLRNDGYSIGFIMKTEIAIAEILIFNCFFKKKI